MLGQSLDAGRLWDVCQLVRVVREMPEYRESEILLEAQGELAGLAMYVPLLCESRVDRLRLHRPPLTHHEGPEFLNVLKILDLPHTLAMAAEICSVELSSTPVEFLEFANGVTRIPENRMKPIRIFEQAEGNRFGEERRSR